MRKKISLFFCFSALFFYVTNGVAQEQSNPQNAAILNAKLGLAYLSKGYYSASKERLLSALRDDPHIAASWFSMAYYLEKTGDANSAKHYYKKAISVEPHSGDAKNNYGTFLCRAGKYHRAISYFVAAAKEPTYLDAAGAYENAGACATLIPDNQLAKKYFLLALSNNPGEYYALLSMAKLSHQSGDDVAAEHYFDDFKNVALLHSSQAVVQKYHDYVFASVAPNQQVSSSALPMPSN